MKVHWTLWVAVIIVTAPQFAEPFLYGFVNWCNVIQYVSGYEDIGLLTVAVTWIVHYVTVHRVAMKRLEAHVLELLQHVKEGSGDGTSS